MRSLLFIFLLAFTFACSKNSKEYTPYKSSSPQNKQSLVALTTDTEFFLENEELWPDVVFVYDAQENQDVLFNSEKFAKFPYIKQSGNLLVMSRFPLRVTEQDFSPLSKEQMKFSLSVSDQKQLDALFVGGDNPHLAIGRGAQFHNVYVPKSVILNSNQQKHPLVAEIILP